MCDTEIANWDLSIDAKAIVCNLLCGLSCIWARKWLTGIETCCIKYYIHCCVYGFFIPLITLKHDGMFDLKFIRDWLIFKWRDLRVWLQ